MCRGWKPPHFPTHLFKPPHPMWTLLFIFPLKVKRLNAAAAECTTHFLSLYLNCATVSYLLLSGVGPTVFRNRWMKLRQLSGFLFFYYII